MLSFPLLPFTTQAQKRAPFCWFADKSKTVGNKKGKWYRLEEDMECYFQHEMAMNDTVKYELSPCLNTFWVLYSTQSLLQPWEEYTFGIILKYILKEISNPESL